MQTYTDHFGARLGHGDLHLLGAAVVAGRAELDLHGLLVLLLTLQAVGHGLDGSHPLFPAHTHTEALKCV